MEPYSTTLLDGGHYHCSKAWNNGAGYYADCHRLYVPRTGQARFSLGGKEWLLEPGYVYLLPGYQWIRFSCPRKMTVDWLHFWPNALEIDLRVTNLKQGIRWPAKKWSYWKKDYTRWDELFRAKPPALVLRTQAMLLRMYSDLLDSSQELSEEQRIQIQAIYNLYPAIEFMNAHFLRNPPLKEVAASVHLSPIYFHRTFHRTFRITPHNYLVQKRMHFAWNLLRGGGTTISEVSRKLHVGNPFYFSRAFKKYFGVAPLEVRLGRAPEPA